MHAHCARTDALWVGSTGSIPASIVLHTVGCMLLADLTCSRPKNVKRACFVNRSLRETREMRLVFCSLQDACFLRALGTSAPCSPH